MQNTNRTQKRMAVLLVLAAISFSILFLFPQQAYAKSYSMPQVDIKAEVTSEGDIKVTERRIFDFSGEFSATWWNLGTLPDDATLEVESVSMTKVDKSGSPIGNTISLPEESFILSWRDAGGPSNDAFSVDAPLNTIYAFFDAYNERIAFTLSYTVKQGAQAWKDVGEVYWIYIGDHWAESSDNVSMTLTLPVPANEKLTEETVRAWGHGPLDGTVSIGDDGTVSYSIPHVNVGQFAEARVIFPVEWLSDFEAKSNLAQTRQNELRFDTVLKEEQQWSDQANRTRILSLIFVIACCALAIFFLLWSILMYFRHGKEYEPDFTDQYWRDVPSPRVHPTAIARLWRWNRESPDDFTATLMYLSHLGAITINKGSYERPGTFGAKTVDDYYLTRVRSVEKVLNNPVDKKTMSFLFDKIGAGAESIWFTSIQKYGEDNPQEFVNEMKSWQGQVSAETNKWDFFELKGKQLQMWMTGLAIVLVFIGVGLVLFANNFIPLIFIVPVAIAMFAIAVHMPRRSREGNDLDAKAKALRNWLKDFSALDERPPTDVKVWGEFMVYAYIFGIAKQVIQDLQIRVPELFQEDGSMMSTGYVPWWFWYSASHNVNGGIMPSASDMLQTSVNNTISTAQAAISAASGSSSSGGGFGGGFSGGGGGGFGGGGGGGAR